MRPVKNATPKRSTRSSSHSELRPATWNPLQDVPSTKSSALEGMRPLTSTVLGAEMTEELD